MKQEFKQQRSLFVRNIFAFGIIFLLLGLIVTQVLTISLYKNVDEELIRMVSDDQFIVKELEHTTDEGPPRNFKKDDFGPMQPNSFKTQIILWSKDGQILNQKALGDRFYEFSTLELQTTTEEKIIPLILSDSNSNKLNFRSVTKAVNYEDVAYVQFLSNTNQTEDTMAFFRIVLIICMIIFWIISIFVSYFLAKLNMKPIMASWKKQQEFVENSSHELRTPLTIIQAKLEKLFTQPTHTILEESEDIALALNEVRRLSQLTKDLLLLARSDSNELVIDKQSINSHDFLTTIIAPYQEIAASQNKVLSLKELGQHDLIIDTKLLTQLIIILIDNALKYSKETDQILITSQFKEKKWLLSVADTGIGLKDDNKGLIFQRFYREDQARQRKTGGYGLGLSIAKWIVESHGGKISVTDNQPTGTIFNVSIPMTD